VRDPLHHQHLVFSDPNCPVEVERKTFSIPRRSPLNYHREAEFQFVKRGRGAYLVAGNRYPFEPNTLIVIGPNQVHCWEYEPDTTIERISLTFSLEWLPLSPASRRQLAAAHRRLPLTLTEAATADLILRRLKTEISDRTPEWERMIRLLLREMLALVNRANRHAEALPYAEHPVLPDMTRFIDEHFAEELSAETLAQRAGFSVRHLSRLFRRHTGMGIKQYILNRRVMEAKRRLEEAPMLKVATIAEEVGFSDFALFNRAFKAIVGTTSGRYRALVQGRHAT
jgi:AraC family transcriptional regulator